MTGAAVGLVLPLGIGGGLGGDDGAGLGDLARCGMVGQVLAQCGEVGQRDPGQSPHGGLDVGWHAQIQDEQRPAAGLRPGRPHRPGRHDGRGGPGGGDQEIGVGQRGRHIGGPQGPAAHRRGHLGGAHLTAAGHGQPPDAGLAEQVGHELARAAGPEHDRVAGGEAAQVRGGEVQARPGQRDAFGADAGLRAGPFAGPQRRVDQASDGRAGGSAPRRPCGPRP